MKARYLTYFSYIGTRFRASEKLYFKDGKNYPDPDSVQGIFEVALLKLKSLNYPKITLSSRTDGGVHALCNSAHFDLEGFGSKVYEPYNVSSTLNKFFYKSDSPIFVKDVIRVPDNFHARFNALSRTYLYRFAVLREDVQLEENTSLASYIPIEEWRRCHFTRLRNFDIEKFKEGSQYFVGYHDFTTFKRFNKAKQNQQNRRQILAITVRPGAPLRTSGSTAQDVFHYWDVEIKGRAFVHNQIRRMVGALMTVAIGKLPPEEIKVMLQVPSKHSWHTCIAACPPEGLYLCGVEYNPDHLIYDPQATGTTTEHIHEDSDSE